MAIVFVDSMIVVALVDSVAFCVVWSVANFATKKKKDLEEKKWNEPASKTIRCTMKMLDCWITKNDF